MPFPLLFLDFLNLNNGEFFFLIDNLLFVKRKIGSGSRAFLRPLSMDFIVIGPLSLR